MGDLRALGWDDEWAALASGRLGPDHYVARVLRVDRGAVTAESAGGSVRATFALGLLEQTSEALPAVGDWVVLGPPEDETDACVVSVLPRRSAIVRADPRRELGGQVVAANADEVWVVHALGRDPNVRRLERELVVAWDSGAEPVVVLNKIDLAKSVDSVVARVTAVAPGVDVVALSCVTGAGIDDLRQRARNRTVALIGASGVGKSTLVNCLVGDDARDTSEVRERDQKGRHTTTARELFALPGGGFVVDTPGMRAVGLRVGGDGLDHTFSEIAVVASECRFRDCRHDAEPECAVRVAVGRGEIDRDRLEHYQVLRLELDGMS